MKALNIPASAWWYSRIDQEPRLRCRAICYDSWLTWGHALPGDPALEEQLTEEIERNIRNLAVNLHQIHRQHPDYKRTDSNPFTVTQWWDPDAESPWNTGMAVLFRFEGLSAAQWIESKPRRNPLILRAASEQFVEAFLEPELPLFGSHPSGVHPSGAQPQFSGSFKSGSLTP